MDITVTRPTSTEDRANSAFFKVMESAPMGLLISAALGLAIVGVFQFIFYFQVIPADWSATLRSVLSASLAVFFEGLGFYFLVTTVRDFSGGARREGYIGLGATCLLWAYALWECTHIASAFDNDQPEGYWSIYGIIGTIICVVRVVELRITLTVTSAIKRKHAHDEAEEQIVRLSETNSLLLKEVEQFRLNDELAEMERQIMRDRASKEAETLRQLEAEKAEALQRKQLDSALEELESMRRKLERTEKKELGASGVQKVSRELVKRKALEYMRKNDGMLPSQEIMATLIKCTAKSIRNHFPNGSWPEFLQELESEPELVSI